MLHNDDGMTVRPCALLALLLASSWRITFRPVTYDMWKFRSIAVNNFNKMAKLHLSLIRSQLGNVPTRKHFRRDVDVVGTVAAVLPWLGRTMAGKSRKFHQIHICTRWLFHKHIYCSLSSLRADISTDRRQHIHPDRGHTLFLGHKHTLGIDLHYLDYQAKKKKSREIFKIYIHGSVKLGNQPFGHFATNAL